MLLDSRYLFIMRYSFLLLLICCYVTTTSQNVCECKHLLKTTIANIEEFYADRNNLKENHFFWRIKKKIAQQDIPISINSCSDMIFEILESFNDNHLSYRLQGDFSKYMTPPYKDMELEDIYSRYSKKKLVENDVEGIWQNEGGEQEFIIIKNHKKKNTFNIILWNIKSNALKRGVLKGTLAQWNGKTYIYKTYSNGQTTLSVKMQKTGSRLFNILTGYWKKRVQGEFPDPKPEQNSSLKLVSDSVLMLTMPSFSFDAKKEIDSILRQNHDLIGKTKHLIVDVRQNTGGTVLAYENLLKWLYTNPIRIESGVYYSTPKIINEVKNSRSDSGTSSWLNEQKLIERMEKQLYKMVIDSGYLLKYDTIYKFPEKVHILISRRCASASEFFLISAMQSAKVTLLGENTYGAIDRADVHFPEHPCSNLQLGIPITLRNPEFYLKKVDNIGIPPNVKLPPNTDWMKFVLKRIANKNQ
jgi:hypothetical protein